MTSAVVLKELYNSECKKKKSQRMKIVRREKEGHYPSLTLTPKTVFISKISNSHYLLVMQTNAFYPHSSEVIPKNYSEETPSSYRILYMAIAYGQRR